MALTKTQKEILEMYVVKGYSVKYIANSRGTSKRAVYKIIEKLREKGYVLRGSKRGVQKKEGYPRRYSREVIQKERYFRYHNLHMIAYPYYYYKRYSISIGGTFDIGMYTIEVNSKNIELHLKTKKSYDHNTIDGCRRLFIDDLERLIPKIENRLGCEIRKPNRLNLKMVNHHLAEVNNGIAKEVTVKPIKIYDKDDKIWAVIDMSVKEPELETVDPVLAVDDQKVLQRHFNAMRNPDTMTNKELQVIVTEFARNMATHVKVMKRIDKTIDRFNKIIMDRDSFLLRPSKRQPPRQLSLQSFIS